MPSVKPTVDFHFFLPIAKVDKERRTVSGYASTPTLDLDGEIVSLDAVKKALPGYWEWRNIRAMHKPEAVGVAKEANVDDKGLFLTARIVDDDAWNKCLEGVYKGFSIGGRKLAKTGNIITEIDWIETSIVDRPANPECKFDVAKRAKALPGDAAVLVKAKLPRDPRDRALAKMAGAVEALAKAGPPAAHDGFSLPAAAKAVDAADADGHVHEIDGVTGPPLDPKEAKKARKRAKKLAKREFSAKQRQRLASSGAALPDGSFPIANRGDLANARQAVGRAKNPSRARAHIRSRAAALGVKLPSDWSKKAARALIAKAEAAQKAALLAKLGSLSFLDLTATSPPLVQEVVSSASERVAALMKGSEPPPAFLSLTASAPASAGQKSSNKSEALALTGLDVQNLGKLGAFGMENILDLDLDSIADPLEKAIATLIKRGATPSRVQRMLLARAQMKKARDARKECAASIEKVHKMMKGAYLAKQAAAEITKAGGGSKKPEPDDDGDFDFAKAMTELQKAYSATSMQKTFMKAADGELKKAASRSGQTAQEPGTSDEPFYTAPTGVKKLTPADLATAGTGGSARGSEPPLYPSDGSVYPGKAAKGKALAKGGSVPAEYVELIERAARAEATAETLSKMPALSAGRRPMAFDMSKASGFTAGDGHQIDASVIYKGVNPADLASGDEQTHNAATAKVIGNYLKSAQLGKSVFDTAFHGTAGMTSDA